MGCIVVKLAFDTAMALSQGRRDRQEDAVAADFLAGTAMGFAVLADGMGGHAGGDLASKIVVTEVFAELKLRMGDPETLEAQIAPVLREAAQGANACLARCAETDPQRSGMGATLLAPVILGTRLYWISVGDSPLFLFRGSQLRRLNADHSMAARLDAMVQQGQITADAARRHPDRSCVTSVLVGAQIAEIDCSGAPLALQPGDVILAASDGLLSLEPARLADLLRKQQARPAAQLAQMIQAEVTELGLPEQDNLAVCIIRVVPEEAAAAAPTRPDPIASPARRKPFRRRKTTLVAAAQTQGGQLSFHSLSKSIV